MHHANHRSHWLPAIVVAGSLGFVFAGCSTRSSIPTAPSSSIERSGASTFERVPEDKPGTNVEYCTTIIPFSEARFSNPLRIDNRWSPMIPGTQYTLTGVANRGLGS